MNSLGWRLLAKAAEGSSLLPPIKFDNICSRHFKLFLSIFKTALKYAFYIDSGLPLAMF